MIIATQRLFLKSPAEVTPSAVCSYYARNQNFFRDIDPVREADFYTDAFHRQSLQEQQDEWNAGRCFRFYITQKSDPHTVIGTIALSGIIRGAFHSCFL